VRIRIALGTAIAVTCMTSAILMALGRTPDAAASNAASVPAASSHTTPSSNSNLAALDVPVVVHTHLGLVIDVGGGHFPITAAPTTAPIAPAAAPVAPAAATGTATPPVTAAPAVVTINDSNSVATADWQCIRVHESGDNYNNPNMPSGAYGILISTWQSFGYSGWPYQAAPAVQDALALRLHGEDGFAPWSSRFACGL
jgi:Transglycosylase-like domain